MSIGWGNPNNDIIARFREFTDGLTGLKLLYKFDEFMEDPKNKKSINNLAIYIEDSIKGLKYRSYSMSNADCGIQIDFDSTKYRGVSISVYLDFEKEKFFVSGGFYTDFGTRDEDYKEFSSNWEKIKLHKIGIETAKIYERIKDQYVLLEESTMNYVGKTLRINEESLVKTQVYVNKKGKGDYEDYVIVSEIDGDKVTFYNPFGDEKTMTVTEFKKKYKKGTQSDYDMFEEVEGIQFVSVEGTRYPVLTEGADAYICIDEDGEKFKVNKSSMLEAAPNNIDADFSVMSYKNIHSQFSRGNGEVIDSLTALVPKGWTKSKQGSNRLVFTKGRESISFSIYPKYFCVEVVGEHPDTNKLISKRSELKKAGGRGEKDAYFKNLLIFAKTDMNKLIDEVDDEKSVRVTSSKKSKWVGKKVYNTYFQSYGTVVDVDFVQEKVTININGEDKVIAFSEVYPGTENDWRPSSKSKDVINFAK